MSEDKTIIQERIIGQNAAIRRIDPKDSKDIKNLQKIISAPSVQEWMDEVEGLTIDDLKAWAAKDSSDEYLFAISGSQNVDLTNIGEIQGFINIYKSDEVPGAIEVSYAKRPNTSSGQTASGLRQAIVEFNKKFLTSDSEKIEPSIKVIADIDEDNLDSIRVAGAAGFVKKDNFWELDWEKLNDKLIESSYGELGLQKNNGMVPQAPRNGRR